MKTAAEWLSEIEGEYPVEKLRAKGFPAWQVLRIECARAYYERYELQESAAGEPRKDRIPQFLSERATHLRNSCWQIGNLAGTFPYLLFTDILEDRRVDGLYSDKIAHHLIECLGDDLLIVLNPRMQRHRPAGDYTSGHYASEMTLRILGRIRALGMNRFSMAHEEVLRDVVSRQGIELDYRCRLRDFFGYTAILRCCLARCRPRVVFINCYYGLLHQAVVYAAHLQGIVVVELQHGIINDKTFAYRPSKEMGRESFPDDLWCFGDYVKDFIPAHFMPSDRIRAIGSFYLEYVASLADKNTALIQKFKDLRQGSGPIVCITSQETIEKELIRFITEAAAAAPSILFIFIPRQYDRDYPGGFAFPPNLICIPEFDFYHIVSQSDFHATVYSTCALEAPFFGTPNVMINLSNLSRYHFSDILTDGQVTRFADNPVEFIASIREPAVLSRDEIKERSSHLFQRDHHRHLEAALDDLLENLQGQGVPEGAAGRFNKHAD